jgi:hypothetical protein
MATVLRYRSGGTEPHCELALENGDHVLITLERSGVTIRRLARGDKPEQILFLGSVDVVADICVALLDRRPASETSVLDIFVSVVSQFRSAEDIRAAFAEATTPPG